MELVAELYRIKHEWVQRYLAEPDPARRAQLLRARAALMAHTYGALAEMQRRVTQVDRAAFVDDSIAAYDAILNNADLIQDAATRFFQSWEAEYPGT